MLNPQSITRQKAFTLIELIAVVVILGIVGAVVVPQVIDVKDDAHRANFEGSFGSFSGGMQLVQSKMIASGQTGQSGVTVGALTVDITDDGWPTNFGAAFSSAAANNCITLFNQVVSVSLPVAELPLPIPPTGQGWEVIGSTDICYYFYRESTSPFRVISYNPLRQNLGVLGNKVINLVEI